MFDHPDHSGDAARQLLDLQQGTGSVADYSVEFRTLEADASWNDSAVREVFRRGSVRGSR